MDRLPPLTALRAFETVGRYGVAGAAKELKVTRAAILHQIRVLEAELGVVLFIRSNRGITLSLKGLEYLPQVTASFDALQESSRRLRHPEAGLHLVLDSVTGFATDFIVPRLHRFYEANPNITLEIKALHKWYGPVEFERTGANVAIRGGALAGEFAGLLAEKLAHSLYFPVCSPKLLEGPDAIRTPEDLAKHPILESTVAPEGWRSWLAAAAASGADVSGVSLERARRFDLFNMSMNAASHGVGVDLGRSPMVDHWLERGLLVAPFDLTVMSERAYWLICRDSFAEKPEFIAFRNWLMDELSALGRDFHPDPD
ncbi:MAG: LysR family transcriptional regulator [Alphaproteobacteria bacterium]|nr:LysR family transcriptional regulator [Alphaproteobacteria bacterium]MBU1514328.1 LysR family transcriptional regulator [Alphaproteobacteria bacterium]MBU2095972.1 LysR family transcriptional regulator [Alphaproteobacteria bacterium]MBU2153070.1 LysR family transcriptional regulator [Alphaproteobacteria bacterium]MBU2308527.1 LysR family transcriptional regulator [Alphaproteobacteria bacterium]